MSAQARRAGMPPVRRSRRQRGAALVIAAIVVTIVVAFAVTVAGSFTRSETRDTYHHNDSVEATMLAETGLEVALWRFAQGTACGSLAGAPFNVAREVVSGSGKTFQFTNGVATKFDGATALPVTQCRVQSTGAVSATNVRQVVQAIIDRNIIGGIGNGTFDSPVNSVTPGASSVPTNWTGITTANVDDTLLAGPTMAGGGMDCSRSLYAFKLAGTTTRTNTVAIDSTTRFSVTRPATITVTYDYRVNANSTGNTARVRFSLNGTTFTSGYANRVRTFTPAKTVPSKGTYSPCSTGYSGTRGTTTISTGGSGTLAVTSVRIDLEVLGTVSANQREIWLDNVELVDTTGTRTALGAWRVVTWHDCRTETCP